MGRGGSGVTIHGDAIRIAFTFGGEPRREVFRSGGRALKPTQVNLRAAERLRAEIVKAIELGTFDYAATFPDSRHAKAAPKLVRTFGDAADGWLKSKGQAAEATRDQYRNAVALWKRPDMIGADTPVAAVTFQVLATRIGGHPWASPKSANNYLIALRGIFAFEFAGQKAGQNPMTGIKNFPPVKKLPDPLSTDERDRILADMRLHYDPRVWAYFAFAFYTGARPEEIIALQWGDIDEARKVVRIQRVRTFRGGERDGSKTHAERDIDLMPTALDALKTMRSYTLLKRDEDGNEVDVFENPVTKRAWHDERSQRDHYWAPTLKRLRIRSRRAYATRHTYATAALMRGINPAYIAAQLGHATAKTTFDKYARWISDGGSAAALMAQALEIAQESPKASGTDKEKAS